MIARLVGRADGTILGRAAAALADRLGLAVLPLLSRSKEPDGRLVPRGYLDATRDVAEVLRIWSLAPEANVGVSAIGSGLIVIDMDRRHFGDETLGDAERRLGPLPRTWTVLTSDGAHFYYRAPDTGRFRAGLGPGLEVKHRGYVVAPPSIHPSGRRYAFDVGAHPSDTPLADLPVAWMNVLIQPASPPAEPVGHAAASFLGAAFVTAGWAGGTTHDCAIIVRCPWAEEHSDGRGFGGDTSTVILPPTGPIRLGVFCCLHGHCRERQVSDVMRVLPARAIAAAAANYRDAYAFALRNLRGSR